MELLLDEADAWVASCERNEEPPPPNFTIPSIYYNSNNNNNNTTTTTTTTNPTHPTTAVIISTPPPIPSPITTTTTSMIDKNQTNGNNSILNNVNLSCSNSPYIELRDSAGNSSDKNKNIVSSSSTSKSSSSSYYGWFAKQFIPAGTLLMIAKPIAMVMDWEDNDDNEEEEEAYDGEDAEEEEENIPNEQQQQHHHHHHHRPKHIMFKPITYTNFLGSHQSNNIYEDAIMSMDDEDDDESEDLDIEEEDGDDDNKIDTDDDDDNNNILTDIVDEDVKIEQEEVPSSDHEEIMEDEEADNKNEIDDDDDDLDNDDNDNDNGGGEPEPHLNELLLVQILEKLILYGPKLWYEQLSTLFPRTEDDITTIGSKSWVCNDDEIFMQVEQCLNQLEQIAIQSEQQQQQQQQQQPVEPVYTKAIIQQIARRLPLIIRYNILSVETCCELLSYPGPGGHSDLAGVALYHLPSFFNHNSKPNCNRWAIGDVMGIVTNQDIQMNTELCISYIEHDILCENSYRRNLMLNMDFQDIDNDNNNINNINDSNSEQQQQQQQEEEEVGGGPLMPVVDPDVQTELMSMNPFERLTAIDELLKQATGGSNSASDDRPTSILTTIPPAIYNVGNNSSNNNNGWFQCDIHNLRILKAITYETIGQTVMALQLWKESIQFIEQQVPVPNDENCVVLHCQAALSSLQLHYKYKYNTATDVIDITNTLNESNKSNKSSIFIPTTADEMLKCAQEHASRAVQIHNLLFGGDVPFFRRRLRRDIDLPFRPIISHPIPELLPIDILWPIII